MKKVFSIQTLAEFTMLLIFNLLGFFIGKYFVEELSFFDCLLYAFFNSTWMLLILMPILKSFKNKSDKHQKKV